MGNALRNMLCPIRGSHHRLDSNPQKRRPPPGSRASYFQNFDSSDDDAQEDTDPVAEKILHGLEKQVIKKRLEFEKLKDTLGFIILEFKSAMKEQDPNTFKNLRQRLTYAKNSVDICHAELSAAEEMRQLVERTRSSKSNQRFMNTLSSADEYLKERGIGAEMEAHVDYLNTIRDGLNDHALDHGDIASQLGKDEPELLNAQHSHEPMKNPWHSLDKHIPADLRAMLDIVEDTKEKDKEEEDDENEGKSHNNSAVNNREPTSANALRHSSKTTPKLLLNSLRTAPTSSTQSNPAIVPQLV